MNRQSTANTEPLNGQVTNSKAFTPHPSYNPPDVHADMTGPPDVYQARQLIVLASYDFQYEKDVYEWLAEQPYFSADIVVAQEAIVEKKLELLQQLMSIATP